MECCVVDSIIVVIYIILLVFTENLAIYQLKNFRLKEGFFFRCSLPKLAV